MQIASGTIVGGKVVVDGLSLPPQQEAELLDALEEADREEGISAEELFTRLRRFG